VQSQGAFENLAGGIPMSARYCYWSVVDRDYSWMMQAVVASARKVGIYKDFHIWADRLIEGAVTHRIRKLDNSFYLFKLRFLREEVRKLNYDYFIWLDADTYFVRNPGDVLRVLHGSPIHATLESDACSPDTVRPDWWGCPLPKYVQL